MKDLYLRIVSPEKILFEGNIYSVKLPGTIGDFEILQNHAPLVSSLKKGSLVYKTSKESTQTININSGFAEVINNEVTVCIE